MLRWRVVFFRRWSSDELYLPSIFLAFLLWQKNGARTKDGGDCVSLLEAAFSQLFLAGSSSFFQTYFAQYSILSSWPVVKHTVVMHTALKRARIRRSHIFYPKPVTWSLILLLCWKTYSCSKIRWKFNSSLCDNYTKISHLTFLLRWIFIGQ